MKVDYKKAVDFDTASCLASELPLGTTQNCEGTPAECFLSGWCNAADMIDEGELDATDNAEVLRIIFHDFNNMGHQA